MAIVFPAEVDQFIAVATQLSADDFDRVDDARMKIHLVHGHLPYAKLSAAAFSKLNGRVRADLRARRPQVWSYRIGAISDAIGSTLQAAGAIWKPDQLTVEQYQLIMAPFVGVGLVVPAHPDEPTTV